MVMKHFLSVCHILLYVNIRLRASVVAYENQPVPQNLALVNHMLALTQPDIVGDGSVRTQKKTWHGDRLWGMLTGNNQLMRSDS